MMRLPVSLALLLGLAACEFGSTRSAVSIADATVRLPAVSGRPAVAYVNVAATPDRGALTGVDSPKAKRIEMHETVASGTSSSMRPIERIALPGEGEIIFSPGGRHLMLFGLDPSVKAGGRIDLIFRFAEGDPVTASARVIGAGDDVEQ